MDPHLTSVLGFSTAITAPSKQSNEPPPRRDPKDIEWLQQALEAHRPKDEPTQMKELLAVAVDQKRDEEHRLIALEDFQLLIEHPYNAGNIKKMNMWEPLINLLQDPSPSIQRAILAILSSAIQNDESTRNDFDQYDLLPQVLDYLKPSETGGSPKVKPQAVSCLTQALKHNRTSVEKLEWLDLWSVLATALRDPELKVRKSVAWLFYVLLLGDGFEDTSHRTTTDLACVGMASGGSLPLVIAELKREDADAGFKEEAAAALLGYLRAGGVAPEADLQELRSAITSHSEHKEWRTTTDEWNRLLQQCS